MTDTWHEPTNEPHKQWTDLVNEREQQQEQDQDQQDAADEE